MTADDVAAVLDAERPALRGLAYRMLGSLSDAEDAFVRWVRLTNEQRASIENPGAWMMRVTSRICLDMLGSARARRETYVGPWLPEPVPALAEPPVSDPLERVTLDDSVSMALCLRNASQREREAGMHALAQHRRRKKGRRRGGGLAYEGGWRTHGWMTLSTALIATNWGLFIWSVSVDRVAEASLGYYINPIVSVILGMVFLGERLRKFQWVAVALAVAGVVMLRAG